jgi:L-ascorbate metabolism protein UlaG (beta-lactamase superfamily)
MTPEEAAEALAMLRPDVAVPIHWGTLHPIGPFWQEMDFLHRPPHAFAREATLHAPGTDVRILTPGDATVVGEPVYEPTFPPVVIPADIQPALA